jgi:hypothetical protein
MQGVRENLVKRSGDICNMRESVGLHEQFELRELQRDDGIRTFQAREIATGRPVEVHLFVQAGTAESLAMLARIDRLPEAQRRRILSRGHDRGTPYVVTDRLLEQPGLREWLGREPSLNEQFARLFEPEGPSIDEQFFQLFENEPAPVRRSPVKVAAKSLLGLVFGVLAAILVLGIAVAIFVLRRGF